MSDVTQMWSEVLPEVKMGVTGVGVWAALNTCRPVTLENDVFVLGLPHGETELAGHLRMVAAKTLIERGMSAKLGKPVSLRVIDGIAPEDWETVKRKDVESRRLQEQAMARVKVEVESRTSWDTIYEQLNRKYASTPNKSLPQNRAQFYLDGVQIIADARKAFGDLDDLGERNYARCIERLAQYTEIPSVFVALDVAKAFGG